MKYHIALKFLTVVLCAFFLTLSVFSAIAIGIMVDVGLYRHTVEELQLQRMDDSLAELALVTARDFAAADRSNCTRKLIGLYLEDHHPELLEIDESLWYYTLEDENGQILDHRYDAAAVSGAQLYEHMVAPTYPVVLHYEVIDPRTGLAVDETLGEDAESPTRPEEIPQGTVASPEDSDYLHLEYWGYEDEDGYEHKYRLGIREGPVYLVTLYLLPGAYTPDTNWTWDLAHYAHAHRYDIIWALAGALLLFAAALVYLCCAAGRSRELGRIRPGGLNRMPLDLYICLAAAAVLGAAFGGYALVRWCMDFFEPAWLIAVALGGMGFLACLLTVGALFACAAQIKDRFSYWLRRSMIGLILGVLVKLIRVLIKYVPLAWQWLTKFFRGTMGILDRFARRLPMTWQWLLIGAVMILVLALCLWVPGVPVKVAGIGFCFMLVLYGTHCFGLLMESTKRMSRGDLDTKVDDSLLMGSFKEYAGHLNALADVAVIAAQKQMKSERMKAELVTNVSHDIKTPLTSIINYVDLLQKAQSKEEAEACLEVLSRQSQRLKKLIEDLMEMSKASTGNMTVELTRMDAVETVNQALGEFSEKLENAALVPVFEPPQEPVTITADGRLTWRVLSNLLSNAVKYALPGTRLYVDLVQLEDRVLISLKNISREQLNVSSDELMERFVRGDASRNTEGSGLGLNIAKSLMELQKGQLQLLVDGDLFKATLVFPGK